MASRPELNTVVRMASGNGSRQADATPGSANARDLGYLDKFLEKLKSQAAAMPRGDARTRLETLLNEETDRWREINALLDTGTVGPRAAAPRPAQQSPVPARPPTAPPANLAARPAWKPRVTIGSLKRSKG